MITILSDEQVLESLSSTTVPSEVSPGVGYRLVSRAGAGTMFVSYYAVRCAPDGDCPVVFKVVRPSFYRQLGPTAALVVKKEAVSLGRLNEQVPPTPFVVRLVDTGTLEVPRGQRTLTLPWLAIEYVHGGAQGTTLRQRVQGTIGLTGGAFDPLRAIRAIECITSGLAAAHAVGVIHRDLGPNSVLCSGSGDDEVFKISDFGMARPMGIKDTLVTSLFGASGTLAPELLSADPEAVGPWTDIFCLASVIYFMLTGEPYFPTTTREEALTAAMQRSRRSLLDGRWLHPVLRDDEQACRKIDFALKWATAPEASERLQEAEAVAAMLVPYLRPTQALALLQKQSDAPPPSGHQGKRWATRTVPRVVVPSLAERKAGGAERPPEPAGPSRAALEMQAVAVAAAPPDRALAARASAPAVLEAELESGRGDDRVRASLASDPGAGSSHRADRWAWSVLHHPGAGGVIRSAAWDGYGRCLAATSEGLSFWNGTSWSPAPAGSLPSPRGVRFAHRIAAGRWLVGGDDATLAVFTTGGVTGVFQLPDTSRWPIALSGDLEDMGILASTSAEGPPVLQTFISKRWLRPFPLEGVAQLASMARIDDDHWLLAGRNTAGRGMLARYAPLSWQLEPLPAADVRAFLACAGQPESGIAVAAGADGAVVWCTGQAVYAEWIVPRRDLSAVTLDADGRAWAAGAGRLWVRHGELPPARGEWGCIWADDAWVAPIVSLYADSGIVVAVTADGGIVEGRPY